MTLDMLNEAADLMREGNIQAYTIIFNKLFKQIYHFANKILNDRDEASDCAQKALMKLWEKRVKFKGFENVKAFTYLVARNDAFNTLQRITRNHKSHKEILYLSKKEDTNYLIIQADVIAWYYDHLYLLPPQCKRVIEMCMMNKNSTEIAKEMGITRKTVLNQKLKGQEILHKEYHKLF
jgi:RNA polymerase sigma-70 factor (ECF subfamily)